MAKTEMIGVWVTPELKAKIEKRSKEKGLTSPEYIRGLVDNDLEKQENTNYAAI